MSIQFKFSAFLLFQWFFFVYPCDEKRNKLNEFRQRIKDGWTNFIDFNLSIYSSLQISKTKHNKTFFFHLWEKTRITTNNIVFDIDCFYSVKRNVFGSISSTNGARWSFFSNFLNKSSASFSWFGFNFLYRFAIWRKKERTAFWEQNVKHSAWSIYFLLQRFKTERLIVRFAQNQFDFIVPFESSIGIGRFFFFFTILRNNSVFFVDFLFLFRFVIRFVSSSFRFVRQFNLFFVFVLFRLISVVVSRLMTLTWEKNEALTIRFIYRITLGRRPSRIDQTSSTTRGGKPLIELLVKF